MSRPVSGILTILGLIVCLHSGFSAGRVWAAEAPRPQNGGSREQHEVLSPLHALLGIDPVTGQFKSPRAPQPSPDTSGLVKNSEDTVSENAPQPDPNPTAEPTTPVSPPPLAAQRQPVDAVADQAEVVLGAVSDLLKETDQESLSKVASVLPQILQEDRMFNRYLAFYWWMSLAIVALLALYPMAITVSELSAWWTRRHDSDLNELDQKYHRTRFRRRLLLAGLLLALAILVPLGGYSIQWTNSPAWLTAYWGIVLLLAAWAWGLGSLVKWSAKRYGQAVVRDLRRNQLELQQELDDLRKRIAQLRLTAGV